MMDDAASEHSGDFAQPEISSPQGTTRRLSIEEEARLAVKELPVRILDPPIRWIELAGVLLLIALADQTIYRGEGFAGFALLFTAAPLLFWISSSRRSRQGSVWVTGGMLLLFSAKLLWCGSAILLVVGFTWLVAFTMSAAGYCPYVPEVLTYAAQSLQAGLLAIIHYARRLNSIGGRSPRVGWMSFILPLGAFLAFSTIFVLANPDLSLRFGERMQQIVNLLQDWIEHYSPDLLEFGFWGVSLWVILGLLRPVYSGVVPSDSQSNGHMERELAPTESPLYAAFRNTLMTVVVLFAVYLVFEFSTLWFRDFPKGFHYSGYAHEGAAWLTAALALATLILSLVFRGGVLRDPRVGRLRRMAWIWSFENMVLAVAVYHRLFIYIGFNGMTPMRITGLYGMTAVVVGFVLVLVKIAHNHGFLWLVRRQWWTLAIAFTLLMLTPRDTIVVEYNTRRILGGDPAPCVQISVHPISNEGVLWLKPLLDCEDPIIREGVAALLAEHEEKSERRAVRDQNLGWTAYQISDRLVLDQLHDNAASWAKYKDHDARESALNEFHAYAYQWY